MKTTLGILVRVPQKWDIAILATKGSVIKEKAKSAKCQAGRQQHPKEKRGEREVVRDARYI